MTRIAPGQLYQEQAPTGRVFVAVEVAHDAGGGVALVLVDGFDPRRPVMIPAWSWRTEDLTPISAPAVPASYTTPAHAAEPGDDTAVHVAVSGLYTSGTAAL